MSNGPVTLARMEFTELGFDSLPLVAGSKKPFPRAWQFRTVNRLWRNAPQDANIGIRGGGLADVAIIDCDEPQTFEVVTNWLAGLGYRGDSYPIVRTASGTGRHVYVTLAGELLGDARNLSSGVGKGEFRYGPGAMVVAPPSVLKDGGDYALLSGDFSVRPVLEVKDILPMLGNQENTTKRKPGIPRRAVAMLYGKALEDFSSRSNFDQSLIASLINVGHSFESVLELFEKHPTSGKYHELKKEKGNRQALHYLRESYNEAYEWTQSHEGKARRIAEDAIAWAESRAWPGRTGAVDRLIFIAHAKIASKSGRLIYAASCRELAEEAGISHTTATRATWRLSRSGLIIPDKRAIGDCANLFRLGSVDIPLHSPNSPTVRKCNTLSAHDVFRFRGLGKSAGEVYAALQDRPATVNGLATITGRHVKTIQRVLDRMLKLTDPFTGEILPMVACEDGETYRALPVDLERIAQIVGTAGKGERQRKEHARDRRLHSLSLQRGKT